VPGSVYSISTFISVIAVRSSMATGKPFLTPILHRWLSVVFFKWCPMLCFSFENLILYISPVSFDPPVFQMMFSLYSSIVSQDAVLCWSWCCSCIMCDSTCCMRSSVSSMISKSISLRLVIQNQCHLLLDVERLLFPVNFRYLHIHYYIYFTQFLHSLYGNRQILCLSENIITCHNQWINMQQIVLWFVFQNACVFP